MVHVASSATPRKNGGLVEMEEFSQFPEIDDVSDDHQATKKSREITSPARKVDQLRICGSSLTEHAPLFTPNGVYFICVTGGSGRAHLSVYSRQTAQLVRSMATRGGRVVRMVPNPRNRFQLYAACADGWIGLFDYEDGILLKEWSLPGVRIKNFHIESSNSFLIAAYGPIKASLSGGPSMICDSDDDEDFPTAAQSVTRMGCWVGRVQLDDTTSAILDQYPVPLERMDHVAFHKSGQYVALSNESTLCALSLNVPVQECKPIVWGAHRLVTVLAFHPEKAMLANGDRRGNIYLWTLQDPNVIMDDPTPISVRLHWHAHEVESLAFSEDGAYMYSGGQEGVLLTWNLETLRPQFLPRLGATILHITPPCLDNEFGTVEDVAKMALAMSNNSIILLDTIREKIATTMIGLTYGHAFKEFQHPLSMGGGNQQCGIQAAPLSPFNPRGSVICLVAEPGTIQFWDTESNRHIMGVDVVDRLQVRRNDTGYLQYRQIKQVAFSRNGLWMATVDGPSHAKFDSNSNVTLKFWRLDRRRQTFVLSARVDRAHRGQVTQLVFNNDMEKPMCITTSDDGKFCIWELSWPKQKEKDNYPVWSPRVAGHWKTHLPITDAAFSADGSLLSLSFGDVVTLWDAYNACFVEAVPAVIPTTGQNDKTRVSFVQHEEGTEYLLQWSDSGLALQEIVSGKIAWYYKLEPVDDGRSPRIRLTAMKKPNRLLIWIQVPIGRKEATAERLIELSLETGACEKIYDEQLTRDLAALTIDAGNRVVMMNRSHSLAVLIPEEELSKEEAPQMTVNLKKQEIRQTPLASLVTSTAKKNQSGDDESSQMLVMPRGKEGWWNNEITPSHTLPPMSNLFAPLVESLMPLQPDASKDNKNGSKKVEQQDKVNKMQMERGFEECVVMDVADVVGFVGQNAPTLEEFDWLFPSTPMKV